MLDVSIYPRWADFDRFVIKKAVDEINKIDRKLFYGSVHVYVLRGLFRTYAVKEINIKCFYERNFKKIVEQVCGMSYDKAMEREVKRMERNKSRAQSEFIGEVKDKVSCSVKEFKCLTSWETQWGVTFLYEFVTEEGNILIWKTGKWINDEAKITTIKGTIKAHNEFRGVKQTELTRCQVA